jgi:hypothetical protein
VIFILGQEQGLSLEEVLGRIRCADRALLACAHRASEDGVSAPSGNDPLSRNAELKIVEEGTHGASKKSRKKQRKIVAFLEPPRWCGG